MSAGQHFANSPRRARHNALCGVSIPARAEGAHTARQLPVPPLPVKPMIFISFTSEWNPAAWIESVLFFVSLQWGFFCTRRTEWEPSDGERGPKKR